MTTPIKSTTGKRQAPLYNLEVALLGSKPPIWRRLQVPGDASLG